MRETSTLPNLQLQLPTKIFLLHTFPYLYLFSAVFEACCRVLERNLKPLEEENNSEYLIGKEKEKDFSNLNFSKNRSNSDPGNKI